MEHYINVRPKGYGHWELTFDYHGLPYRTTTNDSQMVDKIFQSYVEEDNETINDIWEQLTHQL